jgi:hypothetical protein
MTEHAHWYHLVRAGYLAHVRCCPAAEHLIACSLQDSQVSPGSGRLATFLVLLANVPRAGYSSLSICGLSLLRWVVTNMVPAGHARGDIGQFITLTHCRSHMQQGEACNSVSQQHTSLRGRAGR